MVAIGGIADKQGELALPASAAIDPTATSIKTPMFDVAARLTL